ncbi:MAG TPA: chromosomal replication initiator protein DnaA [Pyrinomonadaceae bacterium]|nr:chromosomal replication initiator protein DnaA [Pyrinomonadaceae bacterium]
MHLALDKNTIWDDALVQLREELSPQVLATWFLPIKFIKSDDHQKEIVLAAGIVAQDWIKRYYADKLTEIFSQLGCGDHNIVWQNIEEDTSDDESTDGDLLFSPSARVELSTEPAARPFAESVETTSLNPKYTFDKFVVGTGNEFANAAAKSVAETPGSAYNPLFLYGGVGLGKTHLMHAIGHSIKQRSPSSRVAYITSELFMNELIHAIRFDKTPAFRDKYRSIDVLLLDDIQFMAGKERTQEEFFHTFNTLYNDQKQIVISSDCPPREIPTLEERLHSRFEWGLIADIEPPDLETKVAILKRKADLDGIDLPNDIAIYIAGRVKSNVRELEGSLVRLVAISSLKRVPFSRAIADEAIKNIIDSEHPAGLTLDRIIRAVAAQYKMSVDELKAKSNSRAVALPRQVAMYLCKRLTRHSFPEIGKEFGGKHHTTVMHSVDKIEKINREDRVFHKALNELIDNLCNS